jgi:hypothetical protein
MWGDVGTANWLPAGTSTIFQVPLKYFAENELFLDVKYEWELINALGYESNSPEHRVYLNFQDSPDYSATTCVN